MDERRPTRHPRLSRLFGRANAPSPPLRQRGGPKASAVRKALEGRVLRRDVETKPPARRIVAIAARLPVIGRFAPQPPLPPPKKESRVRKVLGVPARILRTLRPKPAPPPPPARSIPFVSPMVRRVRQPLASTARMVQVAREARKPKSTWTRMRDAAQLLIEGDGASSRMERVAGLAIAASARPPRGLRARLLGLPKENAGTGKPRTGAVKRKARRDQS